MSKDLDGPAGPQLEEAPLDLTSMPTQLDESATQQVIRRFLDAMGTGADASEDQEYIPYQV